MHAVRRTLTAAGLTGLLALAPGAAFAAEVPGSDTPTAGIDLPESPVVDCGFTAPVPDQGIAVGEPAPDGSGAGGTQLADEDVKPIADDPGPDPNAPVDPGAEALAASSGAADPDEFCIAALTPGASPLDDVTSGGSAPEVAVPESAPAAGGSAAPGELPMTGPAPVLPTLGLGASLLAMGAALVATARRRTGLA